MVDNPRWPHKCKIYRLTTATNWDDGEMVSLYDGICRKYGNTSIRTFQGNSGVVEADYALSIPGQLSGIQPGDLVDVTDLNSTSNAGLITDCHTGTLGTTVYFNLSKN